MMMYELQRLRGNRSMKPDTLAYVTPQVLRDIATTVGRHPAETGGILLGPIGINGISRFVFDATASATTVTYSPDADALSALCEREAEQGYELKGFVHSHPGSARPSSGDMAYVQRFFEVNPSMTRFHMPILPHVPLRRWSLSTAPMRDQDEIFCWVVDRSSPHQYHLAACIEVAEELFPRREIPAVRAKAAQFDARGLKASLKDLEVSVQWIDLGMGDLVAIEVKGESRELVAVLPSCFPITPPQITMVVGGQELIPSLRWDIDDTGPVERLSNLIRGLLVAPTELL